LQTPAPYARVTSQMVADGVWFLSGGSHNSVLIEMKDHLILVESPINDDRAVHAAGPERAGARVGEPDLGEPGRQHHTAEPGGGSAPAPARSGGAARRSEQADRPLRHG